MKNHRRTLRIFLTSTIFLIAGISRSQSFDGLFAGSTGTQITFPAQEWACIIKDPHATEFWDFGPGATPEKVTVPGIFDGVIAVDFSPVIVTYSTPGDKTFTVTSVEDAGTSTDTYALHIYDCSTPSIPHDAIVINSDTTVTYYNQDTSKTYWVNPGSRLNLSNLYGLGDSTVTIFAEPGSTISGNAFCVFYMKGGSVLNSGGAANSVIFGDGASINAASEDYTLNCTNLNFDYSNAPPNPALFSASVTNDMTLVPITLSPNPTSGMISVQGLPLNDIAVSVFNALGETVMVQRNPPTPDLTLNLSKFAPGTYYIRFSSANSVVTKTMVRE